MPAFRRFIAAGNYQQALDYAQKHNLYQWRYVRSADELRGQAPGVVDIVGTFWERKDAEELVVIMRACNAKIYNYYPVISDEELHEVRQELISDLTELADGGN